MLTDSAVEAVLLAVPTHARLRETHVVAHIVCDQDVLLRHERGEYMPGPSTSAMVTVGEEGALEVAMTSPPGFLIVLTQADTDAGTRSQALHVQSAPTPDLQTGVPDEIVQAVRQRRPPAIDPQHGLRVRELADAIRGAARSGRIERVPNVQAPDARPACCVTWDTGDAYAGKSSTLEGWRCR